MCICLCVPLRNTAEFKEVSHFNQLLQWIVQTKITIFCVIFHPKNVFQIQFFFNIDLLSVLWQVL